MAVGGGPKDGCYAVCRLDSDRVDSYRDGQLALEVPIPMEMASVAPLQEAGSTVVVASKEQLVGVTVHSIKRDLVAAETLLARAGRQVDQGLQDPSVGFDLLPALRLTKLQRTLLAAMAAPPDPSDAAGAGAVRTPPRSAPARLGVHQKRPAEPSPPAHSALPGHIDGDVAPAAVGSSGMVPTVVGPPRQPRKRRLITLPSIVQADTECVDGSAESLCC